MANERYSLDGLISREIERAVEARAKKEVERTIFRMCLHLIEAGADRFIVANAVNNVTLCGLAKAYTYMPPVAETEPTKTDGPNG